MGIIKKLSGSNVGSAALSGMSSVAGALIGSMSAKKIADKQIKANKENAALQRKHELEDRAYENWYNSPTQEKLRLMDAGLSPAQFVGDTAPSATTDSVDMSEIASPLGQMAGIKQQFGSVIGNSVASSVAVLKSLSEVNKNNADAENKGANTQHLERVSSLLADNIQLQNDNFAQDIRVKMAQEYSLASSAKLNDAERAEHELNYSFLEETFNLRAYSLKLEAQLQQIDVAKGTWDLNVAFPIDAVLKKASIKEKNAICAQLNALCENLSAQTDNFKSMTNLNKEDLKQRIIETNILRANEVDTILKNHAERLRAEYAARGEELSNEKFEFETKTMLVDFVLHCVNNAAGAYRDIGVGTNQLTGAVGNIISGLSGLPNGNNQLPLWGFGTPNFSQ